MPPDYYSLLGLEKSFDIDLAKLTANYFAAQQKAHPDKSGESEAASRLNQAYGTLKNRLKRLGYLIELSGYRDLRADQVLLMEIMDLREEYEVAPEKTVEKIKVKIEELFKAAALAFKANKVDDMAAIYTKIKYLNNVITNP